ncbi:hypothetical protein GWI33_012303 [Rhynchophorus ferrugineus]|uniref:Uncharacterized protein n=1 Tax=Rhynchophorus ferrugineus TaxID=354439 RepID=A0A834ME95_RHYFE|nr:hypothetical protein GWI33_012303 [Rhynchophorus ferrugineus]
MENIVDGDLRTAPKETDIEKNDTRRGPDYREIYAGRDAHKSRLRIGVEPGDVPLDAGFPYPPVPVRVADSSPEMGKFLSLRLTNLK